MYIMLLDTIGKIKKGDKTSHQITHIYFNVVLINLVVFLICFQLFINHTKNN